MIKGPFMKSKNTTNNMMTNLFVALLPIILFSFYKNGVIPYQKGYYTAYGMIYPLLLIGVGALTTFLTESLYQLIFLKKKNIKEILFGSYSVIPGIFVALVLPVNTPLFILIIGCMVVSIVKMLFGGFGKNIFNPALIGYLFITTCYAIVLTNAGGYLNSYEVDTISKPTPLTNASMQTGLGTYETLVEPYGDLSNFFIGTMPGALGETSALLCLIALIYLVYTKTIKWRIPTIYLTTVFVMTGIIGITNGLSIWYPLFCVLSGGLMFGAVFMATDPVTTPVTNHGQILFGLSLGLLTVTLRYLTSYPEAVMTSILTMNMFVFILDKIGIKSKLNPKKGLPSIIVLLLVIIGVSLGIGFKYSSVDTTKDPNYDIKSINVSGSKVTYKVTQKGYVGPIDAVITIDNGKVKEFKVTDYSETFFSKVEDADYINTLLKGQDNLDNVDTVSGATISSTALKTMLINTLSNYNNKEYKKFEGSSDVEVEEKKEFEITNTKKDNDKTIYSVSQTSFGGKMVADVTVINDKITDITLVSYNDTLLENLKEKDYINNAIKNQNDIDNVDVVTGATISSTAIKSIIKETLSAHMEAK